MLPSSTVLVHINLRLACFGPFVFGIILVKVVVIARGFRVFDNVGKVISLRHKLHVSLRSADQMLLTSCVISFGVP